MGEGVGARIGACKECNTQLPRSRQALSPRAHVTPPPQPPKPSPLPSPKAHLHLALQVADLRHQALAPVLPRLALGAQAAQAVGVEGGGAGARSHHRHAAVLALAPAAGGGAGRRGAGTHALFIPFHWERKVKGKRNSHSRPRATRAHRSTPAARLPAHLCGRGVSWLMRPCASASCASSSAMRRSLSPACPLTEAAEGPPDREPGREERACAASTCALS